MQQSCSQCGFESPAAARYCRQCGSTLPESELSGAPTRNYGRQESPLPRETTASAPLPPSVGDAIAGPTERYYASPLGPTHFTPSTAPIGPKNKSLLLYLASFFLFILFSTGAYWIGRNSSDRDGSTEDRVDLTAAERAAEDLENRNRELQDRMREALDREREALERQREALDRAREATELALETGSTLTPGDVKLIDLDPYEYPNAIVGKAIRIPGNEMLSLQTSDNFETVNEFYRKKLGAPVFLINDDEEKSVLYQSAKSPLIAVYIENDEDHPGQLKINVLRSPFQNLIPMPLEAPDGSSIPIITAPAPPPPPPLKPGK